MSKTNNNNNRMNEINTYYSELHNDYIDILKLISILSVSLLFLFVIKKKMLLPRLITNTGIIIVVILIGIFIIRKIWDISWRSNMDYSQYNWFFDAESDKPTVYDYDKKQILGINIKKDLSDDVHKLVKDLGVKCIGESCCGEKLIYSHKENRCINK